MVHCIDCARKISSTLEGFVILEEYTREDLIETYDSFSLFTPTTTPTATPNAITTPSNLNSLTPNVAANTSVVTYVNPLINASANVAS